MKILQKKLSRWGEQNFQTSRVLFNSYLRIVIFLIICMTKLRPAVFEIICDEALEIV